MLIDSVDESTNHLNDRKYALMEDLINTEKISAKLIHFCLRALNMYGFKNQKKTYAVFTTIWSLEQIFDAYRDMAHHIIKDKPKIKKEEIEVYKDLLDYIRQFYDILYNYNKGKFIKFYHFKKELERSITSALKKKDANRLLLTYIHGVFDRIYHMGIFISPSTKGFM
jgi:hypothetical protein